MSEDEEILGSDFVEHDIKPPFAPMLPRRSVSIQTGSSSTEAEAATESVVGVVGPYLIENNSIETCNWKRRSSFGFQNSSILTDLSPAKH